LQRYVQVDWLLYQDYASENSGLKAQLKNIIVDKGIVGKDKII